MVVTDAPLSAFAAYNRTREIFPVIAGDRHAGDTVPPPHTTARKDTHPGRSGGTRYPPNA